MMDYFRLIDSKNIEELGEYVQVVERRYRSHTDERNSWHKIRLGEPVDFEIILPDVILHPQAKFTDHLSVGFLSGSFFYCISEHAYQIFQSYVIDTHQTFGFNAIRDNEVRNYIAIYIQKDRTESFIDWNGSMFVYWQSHGHIEKGTVEDMDFAIYRNYSRSVRPSDRDVLAIKLKHAVLNKETIDVDMFKLHNPLHGYFISQALKNAILDAGLTGFAFESITEYNQKQAALKPWPGYENT